MSEFQPVSEASASGRHQRTIYKIIDRLLSSKYDSELELLSSLVREIVDSDRLVITGGRVWELDPSDQAYVLRTQVGEMEFGEIDTRRYASDMPAVQQLISATTVFGVNDPDDPRGQRMYSVTGVGEQTTGTHGRLFRFLLAFSAHQLNEEFADTMLVISRVATTAMHTLTSAALDRRLRKDLDQAWEIQRGLVPEHHRSFRDYDLFGVSIPDQVVGGDYFDYLQAAETSDDRLGIVISDAASKGLPAAVQALFVSGALRMAASYDTKMSALVARLNALIWDTFPLERFVSLCLVELSPSDNGLVLYVNAGHCPPMHYSSATDTIHWLQPTGGILGIVEEQKFRVENINMNRGDVLVLYTDGITEAQSRTGQQFGEARLADVIRANKNERSEVIVRLVLDAVQHFAAGSTYTDDRTIIVVKRS
jgi:sigma-B regulation protein RsbU (phosphoserine phosphatase)